MLNYFIERKKLIKICACSSKYIFLACFKWVRHRPVQLINLISLLCLRVNLHRFRLSRTFRQFELLVSCLSSLICAFFLIEKVSNLVYLFVPLKQVAIFTILRFFVLLNLLNWSILPKLILAIFFATILAYEKALVGTYIGRKVCK